MGMTERENGLMIFKHRIPEWLPDAEDSVVDISSPIDERPSSGSGYDAFGVHWTACIDGCHYTPDQKPRIIDIENWKGNLRFPNLDTIDWNETARKAADKKKTDRLTKVSVEMGLFERTTVLMPFEDCLVNYLLFPGEMYELVGAIADYKMELVKRIARHIAPDIIVLHDDWGTESGLFMDLKTWRDIIKPHTKRIYDTAKEKGILVVQHSCGRVQELVGDMVEMGADGWESFQACNDLARIKREYGNKIVLYGYLDTRNYESQGELTDGQLFEEFKKTVLILAAGGGFYPYSGDCTNDRYNKILRKVLISLRNCYSG